MAETFTPFGDDQASLEVGGLTVENGFGRISLSGSLDLARDQQELAHAKARAGAEPVTAKTMTAENPFA